MKKQKNLRLEQARKAKGLTCKQMSELLGYKSFSGYSNIELGYTKPSLHIAKTISRILKVNIDEIF